MTALSFARRISAAALALCIAGCGQAGGGSAAKSPSAPPPMPEGAESVRFEREPASEESAEASAEPAPTTSGAEEPATAYWGVAPGEPLPILWEDLMPEGAEEELYRQQEAFFEDLQRRYAANATTLGDAQSFQEIEEGSDLDQMPQFGTFDVVEELDGQLIRIPGYVVPLEFDLDKRYKTFLFAPYMGACIHTPPPPPNQIIFVTSKSGVLIKDIWSPYWIEGELSAAETSSDLADSAYSLELSTLDPYYLEQGSVLNLDAAHPIEPLLQG